MRAIALVLLVVLAACVPNSEAADQPAARGRLEPSAPAQPSESAPPAPAVTERQAEPPSSPAAAISPAGSAPNPVAAAQPDAKPHPRFSNYFDKRLAWGHMQAQLGFGFRVPGTPAAANCRKYLVDTLAKHCDEVEEQMFLVPQPKGKLRMYNIIARINPQHERRILLIAHWDTRPTADMNPPGKRNQPIQGANDGASGVAVLLELARVFGAKRPDIGVDILLTDGEDWGPGLSMMFLGAKHFASTLTPQQVASYNYGILLDMVGDASLDLHPEKNSESPAGRVYETALAVSQALGYNSFKSSGAYTIFDDHLPLIEKGLRVYDFIDFNYPYWHTTQDTLAQCSADSLEVVGRTVENLVYRFPEIYGPDEPLRPGRIPGDWR